MQNIVIKTDIRHANIKYAKKEKGKLDENEETGDVIATSALPIDYFQFSGAFDENLNNFKMVFNGEDKTGHGDEVLSYLLDKHGDFESIGFEFITYVLNEPTHLNFPKETFPTYFTQGNVMEGEPFEPLQSFNSRFNYSRVDIYDYTSSKTIWFSSNTN